MPDPTPCSVMCCHSVEVTLFSFEGKVSTGKEIDSSYLQSRNHNCQ